MARKKITTTVYITEEQNEKLKALHHKTKVPIAEYIRQGIDLILDQHQADLPGEQLSLLGGVSSFGDISNGNNSNRVLRNRVS
jgi:hypothetical protein